MQRYAHTVGMSGNNICIFNHFSRCAVTASAPKRPQENIFNHLVPLVNYVPTNNMCAYASQSTSRHLTIVKSLVEAKVIWSLSCCWMSLGAYVRSTCDTYVCTYVPFFSFSFVLVFQPCFHQASSVPSSTSICWPAAAPSQYTSQISIPIVKSLREGIRDHKISGLRPVEVSASK